MGGCPLIRVCSLIRSNTVYQIIGNGRYFALHIAILVPSAATFVPGVIFVPIYRAVSQDVSPYIFAALVAFAAKV